MGTVAIGRQRGTGPRGVGEAVAAGGGAGMAAAAAADPLPGLTAPSRPEGAVTVRLTTDGMHPVPLLVRRMAAVTKAGRGGNCTVLAGLDLHNNLGRAKSFWPDLFYWLIPE